MIMSVTRAELASAVPPEVMAVWRAFFTAELTTVGKSGFPVSWPVLPSFWARRGLFVTSTSIGLPQKAFNIRRDARVSLLFSDATGSGLAHTPVVLVQGTAVAPDAIMVSGDNVDLELYELVIAEWTAKAALQPGTAVYLSNPLTRYLMDWYFMRLLITITPERVLWWEDGDCTRTPTCLEVADVRRSRALPAAV